MGTSAHPLLAIKENFMNDYIIDSLPATLQMLPEKLFHYTESAGFLGIVKTKTLWATDFRHLNDRSEHSHSQDLVKQCVAERLEYEKDPTALKHLITMQQISGGSPPPIGIISFSEHGDQLSQWRAYGAQTGYAISFDPKALLESAQLQGWQLVKCIYSEVEKKKYVTELIEKALNVPLNSFGQMASHNDVLDGRLRGGPQYK